MPNLIETLRDLYATDKATFLSRAEELFKQYDEGLIIELPYPLPTKEELDSVPKLDREALQQRIRRMEERDREAAEKALDK